MPSSVYWVDLLVLNVVSKLNKLLATEVVSATKVAPNSPTEVGKFVSGPNKFDFTHGTDFVLVKSVPNAARLLRREHERQHDIQESSQAQRYLPAASSCY